jgi:hypothetical protein
MSNGGVVTAAFLTTIPERQHKRRLSPFFQYTSHRDAEAQRCIEPQTEGLTIRGAGKGNKRDLGASYLSLCLCAFV